MARHAQATAIIAEASALRAFAAEQYRRVTAETTEE